MEKLWGLLFLGMLCSCDLQTHMGAKGGIVSDSPHLQETGFSSSSNEDTSAWSAPEKSSSSEANSEPSVEKSLVSRIADREYPSVFQAWAPADNLKDREDSLTTAARHDLAWVNVKYGGLAWDTSYEGLATR